MRALVETGVLYAALRMRDELNLYSRLKKEANFSEMVNDCAEALDGWHKLWDPPEQKADLEHQKMAWAARCIATDDPRLKRK